jgi:hypothetical protein
VRLVPRCQRGRAWPRRPPEDIYITTPNSGFLRRTQYEDLAGPLHPPLAEPTEQFNTAAAEVVVLAINSTGGKAGPPQYTICLWDDGYRCQMGPWDAGSHHPAGVWDLGSIICRSGSGCGIWDTVFSNCPICCIMGLYVCICIYYTVYIAVFRHIQIHLHIPSTS